VALGDSYTIGSGLENESQNFPSVLARRLTEETGLDVSFVNLGVDGYTTTDLIREELPTARDFWPDLVSVLIGANDVVQGSSEAAYRARLAEIYDALAGFELPPIRVLAISTPDFSSLPGAASFGTPSDLRQRIDAFNRIAESEATARGFHYADISAITREDNRGRDWLAADGLHPGPAQHRAIADQLWPVLGLAIKER
jgi:lysophospholipase L1-like esterase